MSRTNLDFLIQVTAPLGERALGAAARGDELGPAFGDHLSQAAAPLMADPGKGSRRDDAAGIRSEDRPLTSRSSASTSDSSSREATSDEDYPRVQETDEKPASAHVNESSDAENGSHVVAHDSEGASDETTASDDNESERDDADDDGEVIVANTADGNPRRGVSATDDTMTLSTVSEAVEGTTTEEAATVAAGAKLAAADAKTSRNQARLVAEQLASHDPLESSADTSDLSSATSELTDQPPGTKSGRRSRKATATGDSRADRKIKAVGRDGTIEASGDAEVNGDAANSATELQNSDDAANALEQTAEADRNSDDSKSEPTARNATRQRGDSEAVVNKIAAIAVASGTGPLQPDNAAQAEGTSGATAAAKAVTAKSDGIADASNRLQTSSSSSKRAVRADGGGDAPRVDPARFVNRVAKAFHTAQERGGTLQLRLSPPELGALRVELTVKDGVMSASLETETATARRVLLEHLPVLRDRLAEQNIRVERFDVDVRREGSGGQADPRAPQHQQQPQHDHTERRQPATQQRQATATRQTAPIAQPLTNNSGINLVA